MESIERDSGRTAQLLLAVAAVAFIAWSTWFFFGEFQVSRVTEDAWIEAVGTARPIEAEVAGRVVEIDLELGRFVHEGEVLVRLDAAAEEMMLAEEIARRAAAKEELVMAKLELEVERELLESLELLASATKATLLARKQTAEEIARLTGEETRRIRRLGELEAIAKLSEIEQETKHERARGEVSLRRAELQRSSASLRVDIGERRARILRLEHHATKLEANGSVSDLTIARLENEVERYCIRAPATGRIAEAMVVGEGGLVGSGQRLGTIVPEGSVRVVAEFRPEEVVGLVRAGQAVTLRLDAFPWVREGTFQGSISATALIPTDGRVRVEIEIGELPSVPLHHGLTASAEVHVGSSTPFRVVMRAAGNLLSEVPRYDGDRGRPHDRDEDE